MVAAIIFLLIPWCWRGSAIVGEAIDNCDRAIGNQVASKPVYSLRTKPTRGVKSGFSTRTDSKNSG
ncbi:hypothetical protein QUB69_06155 [Microcoleus sp. AT13-A6]